MTVERAHPRGSERARLRMVRADDHADVRAGIRLLLDGVSEWEVVGECVDAETAGEIVEGLYLSVRTRRDASQPDREQVRSRDRAQLGIYSSASVIGKEACTRARSSGGSAARVFGDFGQHCRPLGIVRNRRRPGSGEQRKPRMNPSTPIIARLDLTRVEDVMHTGLVVCDPGSPLTEIARILAEERIHCVVVYGMERTRAGERLTWGIVNDRDLMRALDATDGGVTAGALAVTAMLTVEPEESLDRAVQLMASHDVTHVIVVENDYPVGIVSALDVARAAGGA